jgi:arylsulfatase
MARIGRLALLLVLASGLSACGGGTTGEVQGGTAADAASPESATPPEPPRRPNLVLILADDLGWSDIGAFGGEIPTPNIDALAAGGMLLTNFYANQSCSPTRAMLMSGTDAHLAGLGTMAPPREGPAAGAPGYEGHLNFDVASMADLLRDAGYHTYMTGKWHLGRTLETSPYARGFERSFVSMDGASHLGALSWGGPGLAPYREDDGEIINVDDSFYSTRFYTERMIDYIESNRGDGQPFFAWLAYTAPHWPLQAPPESIAKFKGRYDEGFDVLHAERIERAKELGLIPEDFVAEGPYEEGLYADEPRWNEMTEDERRESARAMEIYAAMVSDLDSYIGQFLDYLDSIGERDNTFILFMSDNGPEDWKASRFQNWIDQCCDTSYENMGAGNSYVMYGPNWAWAGSALFQRYKFTPWEGGIRVPAIANFAGHVPAGTRNDVVGSAMDVLPTFLELAGAEPPGTMYHGRPVHPMRGRSLLPEFTGTGEVDDQDYYIGWELNGGRAVRQGDWKITWDGSAPDGERGWGLFNLADDPAEQFDLSAAEPGKLAEMQALWDQYERDNGVIVYRGLNSVDEGVTDEQEQ